MIGYKNISISGDIGTGKTTLANNLAKKLKWNYINAGEFFRKWHKDNGVSLEETKQIPEEIDRKVEKDFQDQMQTKTNTIFESRLAGWLAKDMPDAFKILCVADFDTAMKRMAGREKISVDEAREKGAERSKALAEKFDILYGAKDYLDPKYYNLVVDTTSRSPDETLEYVLEHLTKPHQP